MWRQKWLVHRRLRPEAYAGLVHNQLSGAFDYGDALHSEILATGAGTVADAVHKFNLAAGHDTFLLPMAFSEGSPTHRHAVQLHLAPLALRFVQGFADNQHMLNGGAFQRRSSFDFEIPPAVRVGRLAVARGDVQRGD